jgi:hypothetical protein
VSWCRLEWDAAVKRLKRHQLQPSDTSGRGENNWGHCETAAAAKKFGINNFTFFCLKILPPELPFPGFFPPGLRTFFEEKQLGSYSRHEQGD